MFIIVGICLILPLDLMNDKLGEIETIDLIKCELNNHVNSVIQHPSDKSMELRPSFPLISFRYSRMIILLLGRWEKVE